MIFIRLQIFIRPTRSSMKILSYHNIDSLKAKPFNGHISRLNAMISKLSLTLVDDISDISNNEICIIDAPYISAREILRLKYLTRKRKVILFRQDSQLRFYISRLTVTGLSLKGFLQVIRAFFRELLSYILFYKVGYVSRKDFLLSRKSICIPILRTTTIKQCVFSRKIIITGNYNYEPNLTGVERLLSSTVFLDTLLSKQITVEIWGYGSNQIKHHSTKNIKIRGQYESFSDIFSNGDLHLVPAFHGSGVKNKILIAEEHQLFSLCHRHIEDEYPYRFAVYFNDEVELAKLLQYFCDGTDIALIKFYQEMSKN